MKKNLSNKSKSKSQRTLADLSEKEINDLFYEGILNAKKELKKKGILKENNKTEKNVNSIKGKKND